MPKKSKRRIVRDLVSRANKAVGGEKLADYVGGKLAKTFTKGEAKKYVSQTTSRKEALKSAGKVGQSVLTAIGGIHAAGFVGKVGLKAAKKGIAKSLLKKRIKKDLAFSKLSNRPDGSKIAKIKTRDYNKADKKDYLKVLKSARVNAITSNTVQALKSSGKRASIGARKNAALGNITMATKKGIKLKKIVKSNSKGRKKERKSLADRKAELESRRGESNF